MTDAFVPTYANSPSGSRNYHLAAANDLSLSDKERRRHREKALAIGLPAAQKKPGEPDRF